MKSLVIKRDVAKQLESVLQSISNGMFGRDRTFHVNSIPAKLGAASRADAVVRAMRLG